MFGVYVKPAFCLQQLHAHLILWLFCSPQLAKQLEQVQPL